MIQIPNHTWKKVQRGSIPKGQPKQTKLLQGNYGLRVLDSTWLTLQHLETTRLIIARKLRRKKGAQYWIRVSPYHPWSKKPIATRMGKGKGITSLWTAWVKPGSILAEWNSKKITAKEIHHALRFRLPIPIDLIHDTTKYLHP